MTKAPGFVALSAWLALMLSSVPAHAGMDEAVKAHDRKDYATAMAELRPLAEAGNGEAQWRLGRMFLFGEGVKKSPEVALQWFKRSADQGDPRGQTRIGLAYLDGAGVPQDVPKGAELLGKLAQQGNQYAMGSLGFLFTCRFYGYEVGGKRVLPCDPVAAHALYTLAGEQADAEVLADLNKKMKPEQREQSVALVAAMRAPGQFAAALDQHLEGLARPVSDWFVAAQAGDIKAQYALGKALLDGYPVTRNRIWAAQWLEAAAERGHAPAQLAFAGMLCELHTLSTDKLKNPLTLEGCTQAKGWYEKAAKQGQSDAMMMLGLMHEEGFATSKDEVQAIAWYEKAATKGEKYAATSLVRLYTSENPKARNFQAAQRWIRRVGEIFGGKEAAKYQQLYMDNRLKEHARATLDRFLGASLGSKRIDGSVANTLSTRAISGWYQGDNMLVNALHDMTETGRGQTFAVHAEVDGIAWELGIAIFPDFSIKLMLRKVADGQPQVVIAVLYDVAGQANIIANDAIRLRDFGVRTSTERLPKYPRPMEDASGR